jgi:pyrroline-5-carboxylate reductase
MGGATKLVLIGGGNMGAALIGGVLASEWAAASDLVVVEALASQRERLVDRFPGVAVIGDRPPPAEGVVLAVKPSDVEAACAVALETGAPRLLSIAAGVGTGRLESALGPGVAVVRAMPNTPALVGAGASAIAGGGTATGDDLDWAEAILRSVGTVERVPEHLLDAVTGLSGSGPAYVFLLAEALIDGGVAAGLPRPVASALTEQLLLGSARLLAESDEHPAALRAQVTSPGGTTAAGVRELERSGFRAAVIECVLAATRRSKELGGDVPPPVS